MGKQAWSWPLMGQHLRLCLPEESWLSCLELVCGAGQDKVSLFQTPRFLSQHYFLGLQQCTKPEMRDNEIQDSLVAEEFSIPILAPKGVTPRLWPQCPPEVNQVLALGAGREKPRELRSPLYLYSRASNSGERSAPDLREINQTLCRV